MNSRTDVNWTPLPVPLAVESPDRIPKQRYYDPDFYAHGGRAVLAAGVADGVPARGDPQARRLRRIRDPGPVDHRRAGRCRHRAGLPQRLPSPWRKAGRGQLETGGPSSARSTAGAGVSTVATRSCCDPRPSPRRTCPPTICNSSRSSASCGADARGSTSTTTPRRYATGWSPSHRSTTPGKSNRCASNGGNPADCR